MRVARRAEYREGEDEDHDLSSTVESYEKT
jgi:hypothetical protein